MVLRAVFNPAPAARGSFAPSAIAAPGSFVVLDTLKGPIEAVQDFYGLTGRAIRNVARRPHYADDIVLQMEAIGFGSLPIVLLTGFFSGAVMAMQMGRGLQEYGQTGRTGQFVSLILVRELGPVLTAVMVAGQNSSGIASELGSMKVTEQIDAMRALGTDPVQKLVTPRMIATAAMLPCLTVIDDFVGMIGGGIMAKVLFSVPGRQYWSTVWRTLAWSDVGQGLTKPFFYSFAVSLIGCYCGLRTTGGTQGVGRSTTQAVVYASVIIFILDFFLGRIFLWISQLG
jgi:phospholipid/cholesterol/gamma-HCH transport system permease protein